MQLPTDTGLDADLDTPGHQVEVTVLGTRTTDEYGSQELTRRYTLTLTQRDVGLRELELSGVTLTPTFDPTVTSYAADVEHSLTETVVTATPSSGTASVTITPADANGATTDHDVSLRAGATTTVTVTVADGTAIREYTVDIARAGSSTVTPKGMISIDADEIAGDGTVNIAEKKAGFEISGTASAGSSVVVTVGGTDLASVTADAEGAWSASVPANSAYITEGSVSVSAVATVSGGASVSASASFEVDLTAPDVSYTSPTSLAVGTSVTINPTTADTDIDSYAEADGHSLPGGLDLDASTGVVSGEPSAAASEGQTIDITVLDDAGNSSTATLTLPMIEDNSDPPLLTGQIRARKLSDGRVEFEFRPKSGASIQPSPARFVSPSSMVPGRWYNSSTFEATVDGVSREIGQISARLDNDQCPHVIVVALRTPDGNRIEPDKDRYDYRRRVVNTWISSSEIAIPRSEGASGAADDDSLSMEVAGDGYTAAVGEEGEAMLDRVTEGVTDGVAGAATAPALCKPLNLDVTGKTSSSLTLEWDAVAEATGHEVKLNAGGSAQTVTGTSTSQSFTGLSSSTKYTLFVRSTRGTEKSDWASKDSTTSASIVTPTTKTCPDGTVIPIGQVCQDPPPQTCDPDTKPNATQTVTSTESETEVDGRAQRSRSRTITQAQKRTVECGSNGEWSKGSWDDEGEPNVGAWGTWGDWSCSGQTPPRPASEDRTVTISTTTAWEVSGGVASKVQTLTKRDDTNSFKWSGPKECAWVDDWDLGDSYAEETTLQTKIRKSPRTWTTEVNGFEVRRRVTRVQTTPLCLEQEERLWRYRIRTSAQPYVWSEPNWVLGSVTSITPPVWYERWEPVGSQRLCRLAAREGPETDSTVDPRPSYAAGVHTVQWGSLWIRFTVPEEATVFLAARATEAQELAPVFGLAGGAELVVSLSDLIEDKKPTSSDSILTSLATSLEIVDGPPLPTAPPEGAQSCVLTAANASGTSMADLNAHQCVLVSSGPVSFTIGTALLTLTLPEGRDWLAFAAPLEIGSDQTALWLFDAATGSMLVLDYGTGHELARQLAVGATNLGAVLDVVASSVEGASP